MIHSRRKGRQLERTANGKDSKGKPQATDDIQAERVASMTGNDLSMCLLVESRILTILRPCRQNLLVAAIIVG